MLSVLTRFAVGVFTDTERELLRSVVRPSSMQRTEKTLKWNFQKQGNFKLQIYRQSSVKTLLTFQFYPPAREASKEVPNLAERKNPHTCIKPLLN